MRLAAPAKQEGSAAATAAADAKSPAAGAADETPLRQSVVLDLSCSWLRAGYAGDDAPRLEVPTQFSAEEKRSWTAQWSSDAKATDWDKIEKLWESAMGELLGQEQRRQEEWGVMLSEQPLSSKAGRERSTQILFEKLGARHCYLQQRGVLSLFASGRQTGLVLHVGDTRSFVVPIDNGYALPHAIRTSPHGGHTVTQHLRALLIERGDAALAADAAAVAALKEQLCYAALDFDDEFDAAHPDVRDGACTLPDGKRVVLRGRERFACTEPLFRSAAEREDALHQLVYECVMRVSACLACFVAALSLAPARVLSIAASSSRPGAEFATGLCPFALL